MLGPPWTVKVPPGARRRAVVARARDSCRGAECSGEPERRGYLGHQVVVHAHSEQGCALVGLCLSVCEVGVRAGGVCG